MDRFFCEGKQLFEKNENAEVLIPEVVQEPAPVVAVEEQTLDDEDEDEDEDDFEDETLIERLVGLTEMFPEGLTSTVTASAKGLVSGRYFYTTHKQSQN